MILSARGWWTCGGAVLLLALCALSMQFALGLAVGVILMMLTQESLPAQLMRSVVISVTRKLSLMGSASPPSSSSAFDLRHLLLNVEAERLPAWCNLGYWTNDDDADASNAMLSSSAPTTSSSSSLCSYPSACAALVRRLAAWSGVTSASVILDVGCGCGEQDLLLWREFRPRRIHAVNVSAEQIDWARRRMRIVEREDEQQPKEDQEHASNAAASRVPLHECVRFHVGSATELPSLLASSATPESESSGSFTHVLAIDCAYHFNTRSAFMRDAFAALKPGGTLALVDMLPLFPAHAVQLSGANAQQSSLSWRWCLGLCLLSAACQVPMANLHSLHEYTAQLTAAGFVDVEALDISAHMFPGFVAFVNARTQEADSSDAQSVPLFGARWTRPLTWLRFRVTAVALEALYKRRLATFVFVKARKPE